MLIEIVKLARYYLYVLISRPLFFLLPLLITLAGGSYYVINMKPSYYSEAFLLIEFQQIPSSLISPTVSNERLQFIEERVFTKDKLISIANDFDLFPETRAKMSRTQLATAVRNKIVLRTAMTEGTADYASTASVRIGFNDGDPKIAAAVANRLVEMIIAENRRIRTSRATEATNFFKQEVASITSHLRAREVEWTGYTEANRDVQPSRVPALLIELQAKEEELATVDQARLVLDEEVKLMEGRLRLGTGETNETASMRSQLAALETEIAEKSLVYSETHPRIQILKQRLDNLKANSLKAASASVDADEQALTPELVLLRERIANAAPRQESLRAQRAQLAARIDWLKTVIGRAPEVETRLQAIEAERQSIERSLADMQSKLDAARLGERLEVDSTLSKIEVMEAPEVSLQRSGPARRLLLMAVAGMAALAGAIGVYVVDSLDKTIRGSFDLADALEGQELIMIPSWTPHVRPRPWSWWWQSRQSMAPDRA